MAHESVAVGYVQAPPGAEPKSLVRIIAGRANTWPQNARLTLTIEKARELADKLQALLKTKPPA